MKKALNQDGKLIDIIESTSNDTYHCPVCKELLERRFGLEKQYYAHPKGKGDDCEIKMKLIIKEGNNTLSEESNDILKNEYYNKVFDNNQIKLSDYLSEDGYYLTQEQKNIIFSKEDRIKISALAGAAKSSTLYYYAKERPFKKMLYIVYNKSMKDEAEKSFGKLSHVDIKTIHGLAYGYVGKFYRDKLTFNYGTVDIIKDLKLDWNKDMELASKINAMMKEYMLSDVQSFGDLELFKDDPIIRNEVINKCEQLWELKKKYHNKVKIEHDFYLKLFQLSKNDLSNKYDIILLDESQDGNMLLLDILHNSNVKGIVMVGDPFQALYGWRNAINIMPFFEGKEYNLTTSFRVSQNIANISNMVIKDITNKEIDMKGFNNKQKIVDKINKNKPYVCLCRTNSYIFSEVVDVLIENSNRKLYFEGGYKSYNFNNVKDAYYFSLGYEVKNQLFNKFKNYGAMLEYIDIVEDLEIIALVRMVNKYGCKIPKIIDGIENNTVNKKEDADVIFSTIHRAKGMTYTIPVYISDDHFSIENCYKKMYIDQDKNFDIIKYHEEMCILYVAITRCFSEIELSDKIKGYLLLRYKHLNKAL